MPCHVSISTSRYTPTLPYYTSQLNQEMQKQRKESLHSVCISKVGIYNLSLLPAAKSFRNIVFSLLATGDCWRLQLVVVGGREGGGESIIMIHM